MNERRRAGEQVSGRVGEAGMTGWLCFPKENPARRGRPSVPCTHYSVFGGCLLALLLSTIPTGDAEAQTLLRWKLKAGQSFAVQTQQHTDSDVSFGGKSAATKIDVDLDSTWSVVAAHDDRLTINQTIDRIVVSLVPPQGSPLQYDSAAQVRPTGQAANLASALKPLIAAAVEVKMNGRGEILDVKPANQAAEWMFVETKSDPADSSSVGRRDVRQILRKPLIVFAESPVADGGTWNRRENVLVYPLTFEQNSTYRLAGKLEREEKRLVKIETSSQLNHEPTAAIPAGGQGPGEKRTIKIKSQEQTGTILFSPEEGHVIEAEQTQKLVTERTYRETTIVVTLERKQKTTIKPKE